MFSIDLTESAQLRPLEPWQAKEFLAHMDRARETVDPWIPWASRSHDLASATATLQRYADGTARDAQRLYGIWLDGTLVGGTMFVAFDAEVGNCEIGVWLEPAATGRGLVTRAVRVLIDWAFRTRGLHRAEWHCNPDNVDSSNVARRLGMKREGLLREAYPWNGKRNDTEIWAILAHEWN
ncbi:GNAT family N-acetyltransferase [Actinoplanes utahensis]|uniref:GCN5 family acetyltransferase n=1 Tax=Actinoplanes utahensis TaxID=1869 RepID=A0A0A6UTR5_ACTUT|nr:GNAT family protein [Actinoplanes utahensis]KHD78358.1 GCN5 family acetyltransferase [Actinoplanes utahensis]GIF28975.1 N-acetyltransferase [Actinoplanes utahensis]